VKVPHMKNDNEEYKDMEYVKEEVEVPRMENENEEYKILKLHEFNDNDRMEFLQFNESLCLVTKDGQFVTIELNEDNTVEVVIELKK
jgi:hypothetical protein